MCDSFRLLFFFSSQRAESLSHSAVATLDYYASRQHSADFCRAPPHISECA